MLSYSIARKAVALLLMAILTWFAIDSFFVHGDIVAGAFDAALAWIVGDWGKGA